MLLAVSLAADVMLEIFTSVKSSVLSLDEHLSQTHTPCVPKCYQSVYYLIRYFLIRIRLPDCLMDSSILFRCDVMFENKHTLCSWINYVHIYTAFVYLTWAASWQPGWSWFECHGEVGRAIT